MNVKKIFLIGTVTLLLFQNPVNAYFEKNITEHSNGIVKIVEGTASEENTILNKYAKDIEIAGKKYSVSSVERRETDENTKEEIKILTKVLDTNNKEKIKSYFGETYQYENTDYSGTLKLSNIEVQALEQGNYEVIDEKQIQFNNYQQNDLNNIEKEIKINDITYYLINVNWNVETSELIIKKFHKHIVVL